MTENKKNSTEIAIELCKDLCQKDIEKLAALTKDIKHLSDLPQENLSTYGKYCTRKNLILCSCGPSTKEKMPPQETDGNYQEDSSMAKPKSSGTTRSMNPSEKSGKSQTGNNVVILNSSPPQNFKQTNSIMPDNISVCSKQKSALKQSFATPKQSVTICLDYEKENVERLLLNCHEGKICPTIGGVVNRKILQSVSVASLESEVYEKISDAIISQSQNVQSNVDDVINKSMLEHKCHDGKPCPTINSIINLREMKPKNVNASNTVKAPSTQINLPQSDKNQTNFSLNNNPEFKKDPQKFNCRHGKPCPAFTIISEEVSLKNGNKEIIPPIKVSQISPKSKSCSRSSQPPVNNDPSRVNYLVNESRNVSEPSVQPTSNQTSKDVGIPEEDIETDLTENPSVEIKSTDLSGKSRPSASMISNEETDKENELENWKRNCTEGNYYLPNLLNMCKTDPDFVLASFKKIPGTNIDLPEGSAELMKDLDPYKYESMFGEKYGDPKYHLLMVDSSTSYSKLDAEFSTALAKPPTPGPVPEVIEPEESIQSFESEEIEIEHPIEPERQEHEPEHETSEVFEQELMKEKEYETYAGYPKEESEDENLPVLMVSPPPEEIDEIEEPEEEEPKVIVPPMKDKQTSILVKDDRPVEPEDDDKKKRTSTVSWRAMGTTSESDSTASLDQVVKDATAKAESFRQNLDTRRQHSLLDIVKRKSTIDKKIEQEKPSSPPVKRKKFFNFKLCQKKKPPPPPKEKEDADDTTDEASSEDEELDDRKPKQSSSLHVDIYRRRNTSVIENPVFEKNKELNQFLNNI